MKYWSLLASIAQKRIPGQLVIQLTDRCNAHCPQCGMRVTEKYPRSRLSTGDIKRMLDAAALQGVKAVSFTGGEPMLYFDDLVDLIEHAGKVGIDYIRTGTNGFLFKQHNAPGFEKKVHHIAAKLAQSPLYTFWISIDSAIPEVHEQMRGFPGLIKGVEKALPIFHQYGIYPAANLGINRNVGGFHDEAAAANQAMNASEYMNAFYWDFRNAFRKFYRFVIDLGFTISNTCYPMSIDNQSGNDGLKPIYGASSEEAIVKFTAAEKALLFKALLDTVPEYRSEIRIFSPLSALYALFRQYTDGQPSEYACHGGVDFFFIDAKDGCTYPCGYRGNENFGRFWDVNLKKIAAKPSCTQCDWECFRDPSEVFGPILKGSGFAGHLIAKYRRDRQFIGHWLNDLKYYTACKYFNGRIPPNMARLKKFETRSDRKETYATTSYQYGRQ